VATTYSAVGADYSTDVYSGDSVPAPVSSVSGGAGGNAGFLTGLGGLFAGLGSGIGAVITGVNAPKPFSGSYYTGTNRNPSLQPPSALNILFSPLVLIIAAIALFFVFRRKG
jgi:hypothetical protein